MVQLSLGVISVGPSPRRVGSYKEYLGQKIYRIQLSSEEKVSIITVFVFN